MNGLIGLQEGVLVPSQTYPCHGGYPYGRGVKCHNHWSPIDLMGAVQTSCNAYFCYVFRNIIENRKYGNIQQGLDVWDDYVRSFGFGRKLGSDFTGELNGNVPTSSFYDKAYRGRWNGLTVISLAIGQGELGCTPLQMANFAATIANRGYYKIPHVVKRIHDRDSIDGRFYEKHYTKVDSKHFDPIVEGMYRAVNVDGGSPAWPVSKESTFAARPVPRRIRMARTTVLSCVSLRATIRKSPCRSMSKTAAGAVSQQRRSRACSPNSI